MAHRAPVSDAELEVLKVLWSVGPATVRDVAAALKKQRRRLAYNTVLTLLTRLRDKGYVEADTTGTAHQFSAVVTREDLLGSSLSALADRICDGTASPLVHALVRGQHLSRQELADLRKLLDDLGEEARKPAKPSKG
jgi:BlaI family transcriptional regulator, penicillinase repressor